MHLAVLLALSFYTVKLPLPDRPPQDFVKFGCDIQQHDDEGEERWPLHVWADLRDVPPDPECEVTPKHSWCFSYSIQPTRTKALKDCDTWMKDLKKAFRKAK